MRVWKDFIGITENRQIPIETKIKLEKDIIIN